MRLPGEPPANHALTLPLAVMSTGELDFDVATTTLGNGLRVAVAPDPLAPGVAVNLWVAVGSADEAPHKTGFAHLFEHLMFQGSARVNSGEHMAAIEALGGSVNATTSSDRTNYFETVPRGAVDLALWLEADRLDSLAITETNFETQRQVVKEEKRQRYDNQPYGDVLELLTALHFAPEHPYGHLTIGSMADLDAATLDDVAGFFSSWYRASNISLVLCGALTPDEGFTLADRYLGSLPQSPKPARSPMPSLASPGERVLHIRKPVPHSISYLSWPTPPAHSPAHRAIDLALTILAEGHSSRLHRSLVKDAGTAHEVSTGALTHRSAHSIAMITARATRNTGLAGLGRAIRAEVARLGTEGPTDEEFARAVAQHEHDLLAELATAASRADALNEAWLLHGDPAALNSRLSEMLALTPDDVRRAAAEWLASDDARELRYEAEGDA